MRRQMPHFRLGRVRHRLLMQLAVLLLGCLSPQVIWGQVNSGFNGKRAFSYLETICAIGPRISGTPGMQKQQSLLENHFRELGGDVRLQEFDVPHPQTGQPVRMGNLIVQWFPEAEERILLCCHYDTRPFPDQETSPALRAMPFIGANDGASGVALLMELGHYLSEFKKSNPGSTLGIDFVFFDGEELVYRQGDKYFWGSEYFAQQYRDRTPQAFRYRNGVLLDMVAAKGARFFMEVNSLKDAPEVTRSLWRVASKLGVREFIAQKKHEVLDDHIPLNRIAKIPTCDVIDFDYPHWHRRNDLPAACSAETLGKVGRVMVGWIEFNANSTGR